MAVLYVASHQEGAGKTALCAALVHMIEQRGRSVVVFKPLTRNGQGSDSDAGVYDSLLSQRVKGWPIGRPEGGLDQDTLEEVRTAFESVSHGADVVVVEGSCALTPQESGQMARALDARALVVARYRQDLVASHLKEWTRIFEGRLLGFVINGLSRYLGTEARTRLVPSMESEGLAFLGIIPEDRRLLGVTVGELAEHLEGRFIVCEEKRDGLVEHLMVGGMGMDPGELYLGLRENKAVIVRGDRPDMQFAALSTHTSCIVLTKGIEPIEYVRYEAEQEEVPMMVVQTDTLGTMAALNTLMDRARFDHPLKLSRFAELLEEHVDLPTLFGALGVEG